MTLCDTFNRCGMAKKLTENGSHLEFLINTLCYHIYNIPIGFSDLENVGLDTQFVFLG